MAFGVLRPVVALPTGFTERTDEQAYTLALEHEFAHHRGGDCLANMLIQPLFALHWFNPLARMGWLAFRRDQEAACDARVVASHSADTRAAYADVIVQSAVHSASFPRPALAAAMACPVLGDTSIVHRIRSLTMQEPSRRRRATATAILAGAALALPATATISYAATGVAPAVDTVAPAEKPMPSELADVGDVGEATVSVSTESVAPTVQDEQTSVTPDPEEVETDATEVLTVTIMDSDGTVFGDHILKSLSPDERKERAVKFQEHLAEMRKRLEPDGDLARMNARLADLVARFERNGDFPTRFGTVELSECKDTEGFCGLLSSANSQIAALKRARRSLEQQSQLSEEVRETALRGLDDAIAELEEMKAG